MSKQIQLREVLHIPIVHAHDVSKQIPPEKKNLYRVVNVIKQLIHTSAVRSSRYEERGKFGEHERCEQLLLHISMNARWCMNQLLSIVNFSACVVNSSSENKVSNENPYMNKVKRVKIAVEHQ